MEDIQSDLSREAVVWQLNELPALALSFQLEPNRWNVQ
jgi:hypothetical protein